MNMRKPIARRHSSLTLSSDEPYNETVNDTSTVNVRNREKLRGILHTFPLSLSIYTYIKL
jgi:hypothetical protein